MVNYLLDTNVISEIRKGPRCDRNVTDWYAGISDSQLYLSILIVGEVRKGVEKLRLRQDPQARVLDAWLAEVEKAFVGRMLPIDRAVSDVWGVMSAARTRPVIDTLLAATAQVHRMTLVTRDAAAAEGLGVSVLNPFKPVG